MSHGERGLCALELNAAMYLDENILRSDSCWLPISLYLWYAWTFALATIFVQKLTPRDVSYRKSSYFILSLLLL